MISNSTFKNDNSAQNGQNNPKMLKIKNPEKPKITMGVRAKLSAQ